MKHEFEQAISELRRELDLLSEDDVDLVVNFDLINKDIRSATESLRIIRRGADMVRNGRLEVSEKMHLTTWLQPTTDN